MNRGLLVGIGIATAIAIGVMLPGKPWIPMRDSQVTPNMTTWAVDILHDPSTYPMGATSFRTFDGVEIMARVEWHPPDFQNSATHRGVTLYTH